ncbi:hypothetical protein B0H11DRAFT_17487 [Mycena galericulata]|nr:hypothetical protein B0H11DRAFT_17487 [Mycena galericulata]
MRVRVRVRIRGRGIGMSGSRIMRERGRGTGGKGKGSGRASTPTPTRAGTGSTGSGSGWMWTATRLEEGEKGRGGGDRREGRLSLVLSLCDRRPAVTPSRDATSTHSLRLPPAPTTYHFSAPATAADLCPCAPPALPRHDMRRHSANMLTPSSSPVLFALCVRHRRVVSCRAVPPMDIESLCAHPPTQADADADEPWYTQPASHLQIMGYAGPLFQARTSVLFEQAYFVSAMRDVRRRRVRLAELGSAHLAPTRPTRVSRLSLPTTTTTTMMTTTTTTTTTPMMTAAAAASSSSPCSPRVYLLSPRGSAVRSRRRCAGGAWCRGSGRGEERREECFPWFGRARADGRRCGTMRRDVGRCGAM